MDNLSLAIDAELMRRELSQLPLRPTISQFQLDCMCEAGIMCNGIDLPHCAACGTVADIIEIDAEDLER